MRVMTKTVLQVARPRIQGRVMSFPHPSSRLPVSSYSADISVSQCLFCFVTARILLESG